MAKQTHLITVINKTNEIADQFLITRAAHLRSFLAAPILTCKFAAEVRIHRLLPVRGKAPRRQFIRTLKVA